jgi:hypothetical protein
MEETRTRQRYAEEFIRKTIRQIESGEERLAQVRRERRPDFGMARDCRNILSTLTR